MLRPKELLNCSFSYYSNQFFVVILFFCLSVFSTGFFFLFFFYLIMLDRSLIVWQIYIQLELK